MTYTIIEIIKDIAVYITILVYLIIGYRVSKTHCDIMKNEGVDLIPPSTKIGIVLLWLWDLVYVQFIYKEKEE